MALLATLLAASSPAAAQATSDQDRAVALYEESAKAYRAGDFARAIDLLKQAYALRPSPVLLYNLARAYESSGRSEDAVAAYREFLAKEPKAPDRGAIEKRIETLDAQIADRKRAQSERNDRAKRDEQSAPGTTTPPPQTEESRSPVPWIVAGGGAAVLVGGIAVSVVARSRADDARTEPVQRPSRDIQDEARNLSTISTVLMIAGGAILVGGVIWGLAAGTRKSSARATTSLLARVSGAGLAW
jgi:tetratricopeptide (TPR) repeat protein